MEDKKKPVNIQAFPDTRTKVKTLANEQGMTVPEYLEDIVGTNYDAMIARKR